MDACSIIFTLPSHVALSSAFQPAYEKFHVSVVFPSGLKKSGCALMCDQVLKTARFETNDWFRYFNILTAMMMRPGF
jgi:hypothetical protein